MGSARCGDRIRRSRNQLLVRGGSYPGYNLFVYPGIAVSRLFSEELNFWPKLGVMIMGQYLICLFSILAFRRIARWIVNR